MLFNEPKLLKYCEATVIRARLLGSFSALQRAEIAEMAPDQVDVRDVIKSFSALQRAEIAEIENKVFIGQSEDSFSALQRAEIAEIRRYC